MTLETNSLWEIIQSAFSAQVWGSMLLPALWATLYMVAASLVIMLACGFLLGLVLYVTDKNGLHPMPGLNQVLSAIVNALRSLPSMIMIFITLPLARAITGQGYGSAACIIALAMSCIPMFGRLVGNDLFGVEYGKIEAARAMGASNARILLSIVVPEALPAIIRSFTVAVISIISMTTLAGAFGAGGIGYLAMQYGFSRFRYDILLATVVVLIAIAEIVQLAGDGLTRLVLKARHMR